MKQRKTHTEQFLIIYEHTKNMNNCAVYLATMFYFYFSFILFFILLHIIKFMYNSCGVSMLIKFFKRNYNATYAEILKFFVVMIWWH